MAETQTPEEFPPLKITCTSTDCDKGLHCFRSKRKRKGGATPEGTCRDCGVKLVDWTRVRKREFEDVKYTFEALRHEFIRHYFWHKELDLKAVAHARRKGRSGLVLAAEKRICKSVGGENPTYDGRQTPKEGNVLYYAQHATATCCRKCMQEWHGIPIGTALTSEQVTYFASLLVCYVNERMPHLTESGENIPPLRSARKNADNSNIPLDLEFETGVSALEAKAYENYRDHGLSARMKQELPKANAKKAVRVLPSGNEAQLSLPSLEDS